MRTDPEGVVATSGPPRSGRDEPRVRTDPEGVLATLQVGCLGRLQRARGNTHQERNQEKTEETQEPLHQPAVPVAAKKMLSPMPP